MYFACERPLPQLGTGKGPPARQIRPGGGFATPKYDRHVRNSARRRRMLVRVTSSALLASRAAVLGSAGRSGSHLARRTNGPVSGSPAPVSICPRSPPNFRVWPAWRHCWCAILGNWARRASPRPPPPVCPRAYPRLGPLGLNDGCFCGAAVLGASAHAKSGAAI